MTAETPLKISAVAVGTHFTYPVQTSANCYHQQFQAGHKRGQVIPMNIPIMRREPVGAMESSPHSMGVEEVIPHLCRQVQRHHHKVDGKPFMLIFRRPRHKWELLALQTLKGLEAQLADPEMKSDIEWIAQWEKPDDVNASVYREYGAVHLPSCVKGAPTRLTQSSQIAATKSCFVCSVRYRWI